MGDGIGSADALDLESSFREVENQGMLSSNRPKVGAGDGEVHVLNRLDCLQFHDDQVSDEEIDSVQANLGAPVEDRYRQLALKRQFPCPELQDKCVLVNRFKESSAELLVNLNRGGNDLAGQLFVLKAQVLDSFPTFLPSLAIRLTSA